jgi:hypothetical protein
MSSTHLFNWFKQIFPSLYQTHSPLRLFDIVMKKPAEVSRSGECVWYSDGKTCWSQMKRCVLDIVMEKPGEVSRGDAYFWYSHGITWWSQSRRWVCLISSPRLTSAGFSMTISNTPIASTDFSRFFHDYIKLTHRFDGLQQVFPWLYQTNPSTI